MILGNSRDLEGLIHLLEEETDKDIILHIITIMGALGKPEAIAPLLRLIQKHMDEEIILRAREAINVIHSMSY